MLGTIAAITSTALSFGLGAYEKPQVLKALGLASIIDNLKRGVQQTLELQAAGYHVPFTTRRTRERARTLAAALERTLPEYQAEQRLIAKLEKLKLASQPTGLPMLTAEAMQSGLIAENTDVAQLNGKLWMLGALALLIWYMAKR